MSARSSTLARHGRQRDLPGSAIDSKDHDKEHKWIRDRIIWHEAVIAAARWLVPVLIAVAAIVVALVR